jgi:Leucine-rich repeat (LRR) protein
MKKTLCSLIIAFGLFVNAQAQTEIKLDSLMFTPEWFSNLEDATKNTDKVLFLDLGLQKLKYFPKEILTLKNVKHLYLSVNYWPSIPNEIGTLQQLEVLDISSNYYLKSLPEGLKNCTALKELIVKDHKLNSGEIAKIKQLLPNVKVITD